MIRVPLVLGLAFLLDRLRDSRPAASTVTVRGRQLSSHHAVIVLAVIGVIGAGVPALAGRLAPADPVLDTPSYWQDTVDWLDENSHGSTALLVPGSGFADYVWGSPRDEPIQYLADSPWAVRNAIPLAPPGNIRMLDAFEERMTQGEGSPGLATFLGRAGVSFLVVRNDLSPKGDVPDQVRVHQALADSPPDPARGDVRARRGRRGAPGDRQGPAAGQRWMAGPAPRHRGLRGGCPGGCRRHRGRVPGGHRWPGGSARRSPTPECSAPSQRAWRRTSDHRGHRTDP